MFPEAHPFVLPGVLQTLPTSPPLSSPPPHPRVTTSSSAVRTRTRRIMCFLLCPVDIHPVHILPHYEPKRVRKVRTSYVYAPAGSRDALHRGFRVCPTFYT